MANKPQNMNPTTERNFPHLAASLKKLWEVEDTCKSLFKRSKCSITFFLIKIGILKLKCKLFIYAGLRWIKIYSTADEPIAHNFVLKKSGHNHFGNLLVDDKYIYIDYIS